MAKLPVAGRVKTRLAREIGTAEATRFYRATMAAVVSRLASQPFWETILAVSPDTGVASPMLPKRLARVPQGGGDLGARMHRPMRLLPPGPVCLVGTDVPAIRPADVRRAFRALGRHDAVFGPAEDGGFWLVGFRRRPLVRNPYRGVRWSSATALADVLANLGGVRVATTTRLFDVDSPADLQRLSDRFGRLVAAGGRARGATAEEGPV